MFSYFGCFCAFKSLSKSATLLPKLCHKAQGVALLVNLYKLSEIITYCLLLIKPRWQKAWSGQVRGAVGDEWLSVQIVTLFASAEVIDANVFGVYHPSRFCSYPIETEFNQLPPNTWGVNAFHLTLTAETHISLNFNCGLCFRTVNASDFSVNNKSITILYRGKIEGRWVVIKLECSLAKHITNCKLSSTRTLVKTRKTNSEIKSYDNS